VAFGIAWWRARSRLRAVESQPALTDERLQQLEQGLEYVVSRLDRLGEGQDELRRQLSAGADRLPSPVTPR
jgi:hypothetical protein